MRFKVEVSEIFNKVDTLIESTQNSMNKHVISAEDVYKNLGQIKTDLERAQSLINREPNK